jgi:hypothetical protein
LLGGRLVEGFADNILMSAVPVFAFGVALLVVAFLVVVFLVLIVFTPYFLVVYVVPPIS